MANFGFRIVKVFSIFLLFSLMVGFVFSADTLTIFSPNYFGEQNKVYDVIHYLEDEHLSFKFCTNADVEDMAFNLICSDDNIHQLSVNEYVSKAGCYFSNYDLGNYGCDEFDLEISYDLNNVDKKVRRSFKKQKQSLLINHVLEEDKDVLEDVDLSYYLIVLNDIQDKGNVENVDIYNDLKNSRNNGEKCWPSKSCKVASSAIILRNLFFAGYDMSSRMLDDGKYYMEKKMILGDGQIDSRGIVYEITVKYDDGSDNSCYLNEDGAWVDDYDYIEGSNETIIEITGFVDDELEFVCSEYADNINLRFYDKLLLEKDYVFDTADDSFKIDLSNYNSGYDTGEIFLFKVAIEDFNAAEDNIDCELVIDGDPINYNFDESDSVSNLIVEKEAEETIEFSCEQVVDKINFKLYHEELNNKDYDLQFLVQDIKNTYSSFTCFGDGGKCNYYVSLDGLITYDNDIKKHSDIKEYIESYIVYDDNDVEKYIKYADIVLDTSKYLYYKENDNMIDYLKFIQNNDGSWGKADATQITKTSWAVLGLQKSISNSEYVDDAKKWIYYSEPLDGWGSMEKNTLAYMAIKEKLKPYLKITTYNVLEDKSLFVIENPTIYELKDLKLGFSKEIADRLSYLETLGDFEGKDIISFNVSVKNTFYGSISGEMEITGVDGKNQKVNLIKIPVLIKGSDVVTQRDDSRAHKVFEGKYFVDVEFDIAQSNFKASCTYANPFTKITQTANIGRGVNLTNTVSIPNLGLKEGNFSFDLDCKSGKDVFTVPVFLEVEKVEKTVEVLTEKIEIVDSNDFLITIRNLKKNKQFFNFEVTGDFQGIVEPGEKRKVLARNETRDVYFKFVNESYFDFLSNSSTGFVIVRTDDGYEEKVPIGMFSGEVVSDSVSVWWYVGLGFLIAYVTVFSVRRYRWMKAEKDSKGNHHDDDFYFDDAEIDFK